MVPSEGSSRTQGRCTLCEPTPEATARGSRPKGDEATPTHPDFARRSFPPGACEPREHMEWGRSLRGHDRLSARASPVDDRLRGSPR